MNKIHREVSIFLIVLIIFSTTLLTHPIEIYALSKQQECEQKKENAVLVPPPSFPKCSSNGFPFNTTYWDDLHLVVYGEALKVPNNQFKQHWQDLDGVMRDDTNGKHPYFSGGEYRYYGWDQLGNLYTNVFFINDRNGSDPSERRWIWRPWTNLLLNSLYNKPNEFSSPIFLGKYTSADEIDTFGEIIEANKILKTRDVTIKNSTNSSDTNKHLFNYMYVQQKPTVWAPGSGRMYSLGNSGKVWYQTFMLDEITSKNLTPVVAKIDAEPFDTGSTINDKYPNSSSTKLDNFTSNIFDLRFRMSGTIQDSAFITGPDANYKKSAHYTREDLEAWELKIEVQHEGKPNIVLQTITSPNVILNGNQGYQDISIPVNKADYAQGGTLTIRLTTTATYYSKQSPKPRPANSTVYQLSFGTTPPPGIVDPQDSAKHPLVCSTTIPTDVFDIKAFSASDGTDMSKVESRTVTIDGTPTDDSQFFGGSYIFGDDADGVRQVNVRWIPKAGATYNGDPGCQETRYIRVHDTKPRAQFQFHGGTWKENRKMSIDNTSLDPNANDPFVTASFPITSWNWSYQGINGANDSDRKMKTDTDMHKDLLYKQKGQYRITITAVNALGRTSDPYVLDFTILEDFAPAVILHPYNSQIGRGENVSLNYDTVSTDGDTIKNHTIKVYYDAANNETYTQLLATLNAPIGSNYTPPGNKVGKYKIVANVDEDFGQETIPEFITPADRRTTTVETVFEIDNYIPYSDIYTDIPYDRPQIDVYFMLDKNLAQNKINYVTSNGVTINNQLRFQNIDPQVNSWDMHTYTYYSALSTSYYSGSSYPPGSYYYCGGGYCGNLPLTSTSNNGYYYDYGYYSTVSESKTASDSRMQSNSIKCGNTEASNLPGSISYSDSDGYSGTLYQSSYLYSSTPCSGGYFSYSRNASYSGTVSRTRQVWNPNVQYVSQYTGYYSGTGSKSARQTYANPFNRTTSDKYVIYISEDIINELPDFNVVKGQSDAGIILVGSNGIKGQTAYEHFISNSGQPIENIIDSVVGYIASHNPPAATETVLVNQTFNLYTTELDTENDTLIKQQTMYVHNENFYDNPLGKAAFAAGSYAAGAWSSQTLRTSLNLPGRYTIYRRVQDQPSLDPAFAPYSYYSNEAQIQINVHRKPVANASLDWSYDTNCSCYQTTWVDLSYDWDHNLSDPAAKGIVERKVRYQMNGGPWYYQVPSSLASGNYHLEYVVKDVEGAWSDPFIMDFSLANVPPPQLKAGLKPVDGAFTLAAGVPAGESLTAYQLWTRFPYQVSLLLRMNVAGSYINRSVPYFTGIKTGSDIAWADETAAIPVTTPDGVYTYRVQANGSNGTSALVDFPVTVLTPIQLSPGIQDAGGQTPNPLVRGQPYSLKASTTEYANQVTVTAFKGTFFQQTYPLTGTVTSNLGTGTQQWNRNYTPTLPLPDGIYTFEWTARTPNGNIEKKTLSVNFVTNTPPTGDFTVHTYQANDLSMPIFEGDTIHIRSAGMADSEHDSLSVRYELFDPSNTKRLDDTRSMSYPYTPSGPDFAIPGGASSTGTWTVKQTISDGKAAPVVRTRSFFVRALGIQGAVRHTDAWENNRLRYNSKHPDSPRPSDWFWAGEAFLLEATVTDTGSSGTKPVSVQAVAAPPALSKTLISVDPTTPLWRGLLRSEDAGIPLDQLPEGAYTFTFKVKYSNGQEKTSTVTIRLNDTIDNFIQVHRVQ